MFRRPAKVRAGEPVSAAHFNAIIDALPGGLALGQGLIGGVDGQGVISLALAGQLALMAAPARITAVHSPSPDDAPVDEVTYDAALIKESSAKVVNAAPVIGRLIAGGRVRPCRVGDVCFVLQFPTDGGGFTSDLWVLTERPLARTCSGGPSARGRGGGGEPGATPPGTGPGDGDGGDGGGGDIGDHTDVPVGGDGGGVH